MMICLGNTSFILFGVQPYAATGLGGIYSPHTPKEPLRKADKIPERRLIRRSSFVITGSTGECFFPATSRYCSNDYLINCTDALEFFVGLTGECKFRNTSKNGVSGQLHRRSI